MVTIKQGKGKYYAGEDEANPLAEIIFSQSEEKNLVIEHTYVSDELRGEGVAGQLISQVVNIAREEDKKIIALCSFAKSYLEKHPEYQDVLAV
ncbi:GNAT family N-acetyltransferase [Lentibacillus sediminis]|uniref:GNAT family N-acetyltransferase n=1 Tax=Lentibacillus sediminis TaxID=1940529 RepID=UPI000C1BBA24|nr:GNAT family N-acetyltransferase [Lentibacillus sediminis]